MAIGNAVDRGASRENQHAAVDPVLALKAEVFQDESTVRPEFAQAFALLAKILEPSLSNSLDPKRLSEALFDGLLQASFESIIDRYTRLHMGSSEEISSLKALMQRIEPLHASLGARLLARRFQEENKISDIPYRIDEDWDMYHRDHFVFFYPTNCPTELLNKVHQAIRTTWKQYREGKEPQTLTILITNAQSPENLARSAAFMVSNPTMLIELKDPDPISVATHETIHAIFGVEGGGMMQYGDRDVIEGEATRLADQLTGGSRNKPHPQAVLALAHIISTRNLTLQSSTHALKEAAELNIPAQDLPSVEYAMGYFFMDALISNAAFQERMGRWIEQNPGKTQHNYLMHVHRLFVESAKEIHDGGTFSQRRLLAHTLRDKLHYSDEEYQGFYFAFNKRITKAAAALRQS